MPDAARGRAVYEERISHLALPAAPELSATLEVQTPPEDGLPFDFTTCTWHKNKFRTKDVLDTLMPDEAVARFLICEAARNETDMFTTSGEQPGKYVMHKCACGGREQPRKLGPRSATAAPQRGFGVKRSKKVGCEVRVSVNYSFQPGLALVRFHHWEHCDACRVQAPRNINATARMRVLLWLAQESSLQPVALVEKNVHEVAALYAKKHACTVADAKKLFLAVRRTARLSRCAFPAAETLSPQDPKRAPPDYNLSEEDCWNIKADHDANKWKFDKDPVLSLRHHADIYGDEVFVLQEQETAVINGQVIETKPFIFAVCPEGTIGIVREKINGGCVSFDASFGAWPTRVRAPLVGV